MYTSIVVGTDGTQTAREAVTHAANLARMCGARLHVVSAYKRAGEGLAMAMPEVGAMAAAALVNEDEVRASVESLLSDAVAGIEGVDVVTHARPGVAGPALCDVAHEEKADLVVVGNRGMHGARRLLGSVPNHVAHHAECAVLVVPTC
jgi:nucleotide-binding universal stress UspA family protein